MWTYPVQALCNTVITVKQHLPPSKIKLLYEFNHKHCLTASRSLWMVNISHHQPTYWNRWIHSSVTCNGCQMKRYKIKDYSVNAELEINYTTNGRWIVILVDGPTRKSVGLFRWWWQCQLLLWSNPDLPLIRKGRAAHKRVWGNVDSGMR